MVFRTFSRVFMAKFLQNAEETKPETQTSFVSSFFANKPKEINKLNNHFYI